MPEFEKHSKSKQRLLLKSKDHKAAAVLVLFCNKAGASDSEILPVIISLSEICENVFFKFNSTVHLYSA